MFGTFIQTVAMFSCSPCADARPSSDGHFQGAGGGSGEEPHTGLRLILPPLGGQQVTGLFKDPEREDKNSFLGTLITVTPP